jgi:Flp pilus assembly protein TadG
VFALTTGPRSESSTIAMPRLTHRTDRSEPGRPPGRVRRAREGGQSLVEFAIVLTPLLLLMMGIIQLGLVFNAYISLNNAVREGARAASIYVYDTGLSKSQNDSNRLLTAVTVLRKDLASNPTMRTVSPQLIDGEQTMTYTVPATANAALENRTGQYAKFHARYHLDLVVPLIADLMPLVNGRLTLDSDVTMVIN